MTSLTIFTSKDFPIIPDNVAIIYKYFGKGEFVRGNSVFSWNVVEEEDVYAGTYYVTHTSTPDKYFFEDVIGVLCKQISEYLEQMVKEKEDYGKTN